MAKNEFQDIQLMNMTYDRGFQFGYLTAKLGINWPDIPAKERRPYEVEANNVLKQWKENLEKCMEVQNSDG